MMDQIQDQDIQLIIVDTVQYNQEEFLDINQVELSGFTFGLRSSVEPVSGIALEWGIANATDQYVFKIYAGQLSIVRRSTVPLSTEVLVRNGLDPKRQQAFK